MEISAKRTQDGEYQLDIGYVTIDLSKDVVTTLSEMVRNRLGQGSQEDQQSLEKKLRVYRELSNKLVHADDRIIQKIAIDMTAEQLVTVARLADGERLFHKIFRNLSRQNAKQFQDDYQVLNKITEHQACVNMEQVVPLIRRVAQAQKSMD